MIKSLFLLKKSALIDEKVVGLNICSSCPKLHSEIDSDKSLTSFEFLEKILIPNSEYNVI